MLFGSKKLLALDIGTSSIKLVEVESTRSGIQLSNFAFVPTPAGSIVAGEITNPEALTNAIRELIAQTNTKRRRAVTAIWGTAVITKKISIPRIEERLLGEQLKWEAEQYIPFDINEVNLEYYIIRNASSSADQMSVLLVAAKRDLVLRYAEVIEAAGLSCTIVDVAGFALGNCFEANYGQTQGQIVAVLNLGASVTNFIVVENGEVAFSRDIPVGGSTYTSDIQKVMGISLEEAESLKVSAGTGQAVPQEVTDTINQTNEAMGEEIRRSFDFYLATSTDVTISKVYVTGGAIGVPGLFDQLQLSLGMPLERLNPFLAIGFNPRQFTQDYINQIAPYASIGLGLALRQVKKL
jgi:type IV pilus assembly protein PilM